MEPPWISEDWAERRREEKSEAISAKRGEKRREGRERLEKRVLEEFSLGIKTVSAPRLQF